VAVAGCSIAFAQQNSSNDKTDTSSKSTTATGANKTAGANTEAGTKKDAGTNTNVGVTKDHTAETGHHHYRCGGVKNP
jgi:hypothetical protein